MGRAGRLAALLAFAMASAGCGGPPPGPRSAHTHDIWEAVFRHEVQGHLSVREVEVLFFEVEGRDPPAEFLARFADLPRPVRPASMATGPQKRPGMWPAMIDRETGLGGRVLRIESMQWTDDDRVRVEGGYYENGLSSTGMTYEVEWEDDHWVVTGERMKWIS